MDHCHCPQTKTEIVSKWILEWFFDWICSLMYTYLFIIAIAFTKYEFREEGAAIIQWAFKGIRLALADLLRSITWPGSLMRGQHGLEPPTALEQFLLKKIKREIEGCQPRFRAAFHRLQVQNDSIFGWKRDYAQAVSIGTLPTGNVSSTDLEIAYGEAYSAHSLGIRLGLPMLRDCSGAEKVARLDRYDELMVSIGIRCVAKTLFLTQQLEDLLAKKRIVLRDELKLPTLSLGDRWGEYYNI